MKSTDIHRTIMVNWDALDCIDLPAFVDIPADMLDEDVETFLLGKYGYVVLTWSETD